MFRLVDTRQLSHSHTLNIIQCRNRFSIFYIVSGSQGTCTRANEKFSDFAYEFIKLKFCKWSESPNEYWVYSGLALVAWCIRRILPNRQSGEYVGLESVWSKSSQMCLANAFGHLSKLRNICIISLMQMLTADVGGPNAIANYGTLHIRIRKCIHIIRACKQAHVWDMHATWAQYYLYLFLDTLHVGRWQF